MSLRPRAGNRAAATGLANSARSSAASGRITPETAQRLARYFGGSAAIWLRLQVGPTI